MMPGCLSIQPLSGISRPAFQLAVAILGSWFIFAPASVAVGDDARALRLMGGANPLEKAEDIQSAIRDHQLAVSLRPWDVELHLVLGREYAEIGQLEAAIRQFEEASRMSPASAGVHLYLANAYFDSGRLEKALVHYLEAIRLAPDLAEAHRNLGFLYLELGLVRRSIIEFQKAVGSHPASGVIARELQRKMSRALER